MFTEYLVQGKLPGKYSTRYIHGSKRIIEIQFTRENQKNFMGKLYWKKIHTQGVEYYQVHLRLPLNGESCYLDSKKKILCTSTRCLASRIFATSPSHDYF